MSEGKLGAGSGIVHVGLESKVERYARDLCITKHQIQTVWGGEVHDVTVDREIYVQ